MFILQQISTNIVLAHSDIVCEPPLLEIPMILTPPKLSMFFDNISTHFISGEFCCYGRCEYAEPNAEKFLLSTRLGRLPVMPDFNPASSLNPRVLYCHIKKASYNLILLDATNSSTPPMAMYYLKKAPIYLCTGEFCA